MDKKNNNPSRSPINKVKETVPLSKVTPAEKGYIPESKINKKSLHLKFFLVVICGFTLLLSIFIFALYYTKNLTPGAILNKTLLNLGNNKNFKYNGDIKLTFSSSQSQSNADLNEMEIYSIIGKSNSDNHEISVQGEFNRGGNFPTGNFNLVWSISGKKAFGFDGKTSGYEILYKAQSYPYSGLVSERSSDEYSSLNLKDLLTKIYFESGQSDFPNVNLNSFNYEVIEVLPDDIIDSQKSYHYKIKISPKENINNIFSNVTFDNWDIWVGKKSHDILRVEGVIKVNNVGIEGNGMNIQFDVKLSWS